MKRIHGMKWLLMGLALIGFSLYTQPFWDGGEHTVLSAVLVVVGLYCPIVGLGFCIYGFLKRDE